MNKELLAKAAVNALDSEKTSIDAATGKVINAPLAFPPSAPSESIVQKRAGAFGRIGKGMGTGGAVSSMAARSGSGGGSDTPNKLLRDTLNQSLGVSGGNPKHESKFLESLVLELRKQIVTLSQTAHERFHEILRLRGVLKSVSADSETKNETHNAMTEKLNGVKTERSALQRQLLLANAQYLRAECLASSLERQLKHAIAVIGHHSSSSPLNSAAPNTVHASESAALSNASQRLQPPTSIDYSFFPDLEPSPALRSAISSPDILRQLSTAGGAISIASGGANADSSYDYVPATAVHETSVGANPQIGSSASLSTAHSQPTHASAQRSVRGLDEDDDDADEPSVESTPVPQPTTQRTVVPKPPQQPPPPLYPPPQSISLSTLTPASGSQSARGHSTVTSVGGGGRRRGTSNVFAVGSSIAATASAQQKRIDPTNDSNTTVVPHPPNTARAAKSDAYLDFAKAVSARNSQ